MSLSQFSNRVFVFSFFFLGIYIPVFIGHILENVIHLVGSEAKIWF